MELNIFVLLFLSQQVSSSTRKYAMNDLQQELSTPGTGPTFDTSVPGNLTGLVGKTAYLNCRVKNLGNRTVSWVRHKDIHLLTVGRYTYTSDQRFESVHSPHTEDWTLRIRYPQKEDSGTYECQISTTPPIGHPVYLSIVEPTTEILGGPEMFINIGSTINLTCIVSFTPEPPPTILWRHDRKLINFENSRGGISLVTEKGAVTRSRLLIQKADKADNGLYSCDPTTAAANTIHVHILNEHPAAMHHGHGSSHFGPPVFAALLLSLLSNVLVYPLML
ncbi:zwei Ig domain protein zig-8-like isoform X2 [Macrosteles quadrilineatus]|uniref:zwei Ig domain protein zig-8-like isoform X2 n=1 Tax=Macrosteles quadrilineatus TaxID=74068 RepID=UPI0023E24445|nr:zwei Ig domain protein zig-8-like isoform X2 [Macrosteles quadrilineatus]XP_054275404.1 zwei Ig domain protein zig-8-like isoform X2 [Macrosteles quadrilineatus]